MLKLVRVFSMSLAVGLAACASTAATGQGVATPVADGAVASSLASKLGVDEKYVSLALYTAKESFRGAIQTPVQRVAAAKSGVDQASVQAQADGKPLATEQKQGLFEGVRDAL